MNLNLLHIYRIKNNLQVSTTVTSEVIPHSKMLLKSALTFAALWSAIIAVPIHPIQNAAVQPAAPIKASDSDVLKSIITIGTKTIPIYWGIRERSDKGLRECFEIPKNTKLRISTDNGGIIGYKVHESKETCDDSAKNYKINSCVSSIHKDADKPLYENLFTCDKDIVEIGASPKVTYLYMSFIAIF